MAFDAPEHSWADRVVQAVDAARDLLSSESSEATADDTGDDSYDQGDDDSADGD